MKQNVTVNEGVLVLHHVLSNLYLIFSGDLPIEVENCLSNLIDLLSKEFHKGYLKDLDVISTELVRVINYEK